MLGRTLILAVLVLPMPALAQDAAEPKATEPPPACDPTSDVLCARPALPTPDVVSHGQIMMGIAPPKKPKPTDTIQRLDRPRPKMM